MCNDRYVTPAPGEMTSFLGCAQSGSGWGFGQDRLEGGVFEKADFDADGDNLGKVGGGGEVFAPGAEVSEAKMAGAGEFQAGGDDGGIEIDDGAELDFDAELHAGGGEGFAVEDPAATVGEGGGEGGKKAVAFFVTEALDVERLHEGRASRMGLLPLWCSSENGEEGVRVTAGTVVM